MRPPRLLFVVTEDWYFVSHRLALAVAARNAGFDVAVATSVAKHGDVIRSAGLRLLPIGLSRRYGRPLREMAELARVYRRERPDLVHLVALKPIVYGGLAAWAAGVPARVHAVAGLGWIFTSTSGFRGLLRPLFRGLLSSLLRARGSVAVVQNPDDRDILRRARLPERRVRLIRGAGVDTAAFEPAPAPPPPVRVVLHSRMLWDKGVGEFVEAARRLSARGLDARFVLVGEPDPANPTSVPEATLRAWHGRDGVEWWGRREDMPAVLRSAHVACLPSYREGLPKSLLEAGACGLPMVAADVPGCREVVRPGENGFLVPPRNPEALAEALRVLIENPSLRADMGRRSREIVLTEFPREKVIAETMAVYRELLA